MITSCPLCKSPEGKDFIHCPDHLVTNDIFTVRQCNHCSFLYTSDEPGPERIGAYYESQAYEPLRGQRSKLRSFVRSIRQKNVAMLVEHHVTERNGAILDIGCGMGDFLDIMRARGWNIRGIEPDATCRRQLCARGISVIPPSDISTIPDASADIITLWHVLEHVHGLTEFGHQLSRILKPDGVIVIAVPNAQAFDAKMYGKHWHAYELPRHLYHFTRESLIHFAETSGLTIVRLRTMPLDSVYCCLQSEKYVNGSPLRGMLRALFTIAVATVRPSSSTTIFAVLKHNR